MYSYIYLKKNYSALESLSITLKIHVILEHIEDCINFFENNEGLGVWSEQAGESVHPEFLKIWNRYKVNDISKQLYLDKLKKAVAQFSSTHI